MRIAGAGADARLRPTPSAEQSSRCMSGAMGNTLGWNRSGPPLRAGAGDTLPATMLVWSRRVLPLVIAAIFAVAATAALAGTTHGGPLTGKWSGNIAGGGKRQHIVIVVNAKETGGSWTLSATCYGPLTLDSISNGYHHYLRHRGRGATCAGGDIDCLKRVGANVYDAVTSRLGGAYDSGGTLRRVRRK
jgi:hypothetical protein